MRKASDKLEWLALVAENSRITPSQFKVAFTLINHLNLKTQKCNPSVSRVASLSGVQPRAVRRTIKALEAEKLLTVSRVKGGDQNETNSFKFCSYSINTGLTPVSTDTPVSRDTPVPTGRFESSIFDSPRESINTGLTPVPGGPLPLSPGTPRNRKRIANASATRARVDPQTTKNHNPESPALTATLAKLGFPHHQVHTPKVIAMLQRWRDNGVTPNDVETVTRTLRERNANREFGPAYLEKPVDEYLEAKRNGNEKRWRSGNSGSGKRETLGERTARRLGIVEQ